MNRSRCSRSACPSRPAASSHSGCGSSISSDSATPALQRLEDARAARDERLLVDVAAGLLRPGDAAERQLQGDHVVEPASHGGPAAAHERLVASHQPVVPDADGEVGASCWSRRWRPRRRRPRASSARSRRRAGWPGTSRRRGARPAISPPSTSAIAASTWFQTSVCAAERPRDRAVGLLDARDRRGGRPRPGAGRAARAVPARRTLMRCSSGLLQVERPGSCRSAGRAPARRAGSRAACA